MNKEKRIALRIFINIIFIGFITYMIFLSYNHNIKRDISYLNTIENLYHNLNKTELQNISLEMEDTIQSFNISLENEIKENLTSEKFIEEYKNIENTTYNDLFHIIKKNVYKFNLDKNSLIVGTKDSIIYNNSLDEYNIYKWNDFLENETINNLISGNLTKIYVKYENNDFSIVNESEILYKLINEPSELIKYNLFIPSQITNYGDLIGNNDIKYNDKNKVSDYKILILYRKNMMDIYNSYLLSLSNPNHVSFSYYYDYITILIVIIIWFIYVITSDKLYRIIYLSKFKIKK